MACHKDEPNFLKNFQIPSYILVPESKGESIEINHDAPTCPVLVFINSKSGGQLGGDLLKTYCTLLNEKQVFDLGEEAPNEVLRGIYGNFENLKLLGDQFAIRNMERLKLIVAGGDGTAGWLLGVVCDLKLSHPPPIATVPLGTGNNLPFAFGWGKKNPGTNQHVVRSFLNQVMEAKEMKIDNWHILMRMRTAKEGSCDPIAPLELPHSLHVFYRVSEADELNMVAKLFVVDFGTTSAWVTLMDKTEKTQNLQHCLHHPQHFHPLRSYDAPFTLLASERYTRNVTNFYRVSGESITAQ